MISESARYYGAALAYIVNCAGGPIQIEEMDTDSAGFYLLNRRTPIYTKYSTERHSPWTFNFHRRHQEQQQALFDVHGECIVAFVCGRDGIAAVAHGEFRKVLDNVFEQQESVSIRRRHTEMYQIKGRDGELDRRVSRNSLAELLVQLSPSPKKSRFFFGLFGRK